MMGIGYNSGDTGWEGEIDEVMVWNVARTPTQILADRRGHALAQPGMLAYFKFNEGAGQTTANLVTGGPTGTLGATTAVEARDPQWTNSNVLAAPADLAAPALSLSVAPNPSLGATTISYSLAAPMVVRLTVLDATGREVALLVEGTQAAGTHTVPFGSAALPTGLYTCRLSTPAGSRTSRLVLTR